MPETTATALLSLSDTTGAVELARALVESGTALVATAGTKAFLERHGIAARDVEGLTGFPALFDGRVKTLHPAIFGAILFDRDSPEHRAQASERAIPPIAVVAVTLYPPPEIDIGGVALLRAGAKNYAHVSVLSNPSQYDTFTQALRGGGTTLAHRRELAIAALERTAAYDTENAARLAGGPDARLRYGENPHQRGLFFAGGDALPEQLAGKTLSYNNLLDLDATLRLLARADSTAHRVSRAVVVKHTIPCGVAERADVADALAQALDADRISAYGGAVAVDGRVTRAAADVLKPVFLEVVAAHAYDEDALAELRRKRNLRIMTFPPALPERLARERRVRSALGGTLVEEPDDRAEPEHLRVVSRRAPTQQERSDMLFAWDIVRHVKSNGIVVAKDGVTRGICAGQTNRLSAVQIAGERAGEHARGAACASDGFFPFADGLEAASAAGCTAVIAPGGSIRDAEVIAAADAAGIALTFSSRRYFAH